MRNLNHYFKQYQLLTDWYLSVLEGIKEEDGNKTVDGKGNSLEWLAGHLIIGRYRNMLRLGIQLDPPETLDLFINQSIPPPNAIAFNTNTKYPTLHACIEQWKVYAKIFPANLNSLDEGILQNEMSFSVASGGNTVEDALIFVVLHESFHIGQMSIIRKHLGYPAMQLTLRK